MAEALRDAGVQSVNISLDTLDAAVYSQITGRDFHAKVLDGVDAAIVAGFDQINSMQSSCAATMKINCCR